MEATRKNYEGTILDSHAETAKESGVSTLEAHFHALARAYNYWKNDKDFLSKGTKGLGPTHISSVFL